MVQLAKSDQGAITRARPDIKKGAGLAMVSRSEKRLYKDVARQDARELGVAKLGDMRKCLAFQAALALTRASVTVLLFSHFSSLPVSPQCQKKRNIEANSNRQVLLALFCCRKWDKLAHACAASCGTRIAHRWGRSY